MHQNRRRQPGMGLMLLFYQLFGVIGIDKIPPVTLSCIGLQVAIFLRLFKLPWRGASDICISAYKVWRKREFSRLLFGAFEHGDDWHLYYNMISFALKGQSLERRYGSKKFLYIIACFTVLTNIVLVALSIFAGEFFDHSEKECAVGFSGVIFALKVLTTYYDSNLTHRIMGIPLLMPARYAVWVELLLIQLLVPNVSFFGHLAGVLVGMAYVKGPLKYFMDLLYSLLYSIVSPMSPSQPRTMGPGPNRSEFFERAFGQYDDIRISPNTGTTFFQRMFGSDPGITVNPQARRTFSEFIPPGMSEEEQLRRAMEESIEDSDPTPNAPPPYPTSFGFSNSPPPRSRSGGSPPPPGFIEEVLHSPPPPGLYPNIDELRSHRTARYTSY